MDSYCKNSWLFHIFVALVLVVVWCAQSTSALSTFGFDIHHRYSDTVKRILDNDGLPERDTVEYYAALVHRDHFLRGRRLAGNDDSVPLTFAGGNMTFNLQNLGFLHYAVVSVGTPIVNFLVALDTGSDLFWLPCQCKDCVRSVKIGGRQLELNQYSVNASSTSSVVSCNSAMCRAAGQCLTEQNLCVYQVGYLSANTSSTGVLVDDVLHLSTNDNQQTTVDAPITLGCGMIQTGAFLSTGAPNGLFGLGMENVSVPSILANKGLTANSFSMCFGRGGLGRIVFGDKGSSGQGETPFNLEQLHQSYNISINSVVIGEKVSALDFTAHFDSGTSFTTLHDPVYTTIADTFDAQVQDPRLKNDSRIPFKYCYSLKSTPSGFETPKAPNMTFIMKGGDQFNVSRLVIFNLEDVGYVYCLGIVKSENVSIIGQNFMTGYRIAFDREKMVLGWKASDCNDDGNSGTGQITPPPSTSMPPPPPPPPPRPIVRSNSSEPPPPPAEVPGATPENTANSPPGLRLPGTGNAPRLNSFTCKLLMVLLSVCSHYLIFLS